MSFGQILYYDGCSRDDAIEKKKKEKCMFREFDNEENEHRTKSLLWRIR